MTNTLSTEASGATGKIEGILVVGRLEEETRTLADAQAMISAGASRLGTSSGIEIVRAALEEGKSNE